MIYRRRVIDSRSIFQGICPRRWRLLLLSVYRGNDRLLPAAKSWTFITAVEHAQPWIIPYVYTVTYLFFSLGSSPVHRKEHDRRTRTYPRCPSFVPILHRVKHYHTRVIRYHTPWDEFQTRFPPKHALRAHLYGGFLFFSNWFLRFFF